MILGALHQKAGRGAVGLEESARGFSSKSCFHPLGNAIHHGLCGHKLLIRPVEKNSLDYMQTFPTCKPFLHANLFYNSSRYFQKGSHLQSSRGINRGFPIIKTNHLLKTIRTEKTEGHCKLRQRRSFA